MTIKKKISSEIYCRNCNKHIATFYISISQQRLYEAGIIYCSRKCFDECEKI